MKRIDKIKTVVVVSLILLAVSTAVISVDAHMPGAKPLPKYDLAPISIYDGDTLVEISVEDVREYHGDICVCGACAFRATQLGISEIWGDERPARDDIRIISRLPTPGSRDCFRYITGTGPGIETKTKGEYKIILPDGTEVTDMSKPNLKKISKGNSRDNFRFDICRKSTGDCYEVAVKEGVFPDDFFVLREKVKFSVPAEATAAEKKTFKSKWADTRDKFLLQPDQELFEGVKKPAPKEPGFEAVFAIAGILAVAYLVLRRKK